MESAHQDDENLYKLSVEVGMARVSMTKLPFHASGEEGDDTPALWIRAVIRITPDPNYLPRTRYAPCRQWFRLNNGTLLVLTWEYHSYSIFILDIEKKVMEEVKHSFLCEKNYGGNLAFVPYEMDLVKFFVLRLGRICED
jgi:hypothetical protein